MPGTVNIPVQTYSDRFRVQKEKMSNFGQNRPQTDSGIRFDTTKIQNRISSTFKRLSEMTSPSQAKNNDVDDRRGSQMIIEEEYRIDNPNSEAPQVLILDDTSGSNARASPYLYNPPTEPRPGVNAENLIDNNPKRKKSIPVYNFPPLAPPPNQLKVSNNNKKVHPKETSKRVVDNSNNKKKIINNDNNNNSIKKPPALPNKSSSTKKGSYKRSVLYTFLGLAGFLSFDPLVDGGLGALLKLKDGGLVTDNWTKLPLPISACFYLFELKNGKDFRNGAKPHIEEVGPFCYDEYKDKNIIEWKDDRVKYTEKIRFIFRPEDSKSLDTVVETLNYPLMVVVQLAKYLLKTLYLSFTSPLVMNLVMTLMTATDEKLIETRTAKEMLEGRKLKLVDIFDSLANPLRNMGINVPGIGVGFYMLNNASFGFVALRQITEFGPYEVYTETKNGHAIGEFYKFDNKRSLSGYKSPCNRVSGGEGIFLGENFKAEEINIFNQHLCRTVTLKRNGTSYRTGAALKRYTTPPDAYDADLPSNKCYCPAGRTKRQCTGMSDMSPCFGGVQLYLSYPHFLFSPERQREFEGLRPDPEKHQGEVIIEDRIGAPIYVSLSGQVSVHVEPFSSVSTLRRLPQVPYPMFWVNEGLELAKPLEILAGIGANTLQFGSWLILAAGLGAGGTSAYRTQRRNSRIIGGR